jgi:hypothetical protein
MSVLVHNKVMFEIYRESGYDHRYRVVYFTELDEHNRSAEIARATAGEHCWDGFLREDLMAEAKAIIALLLDRLNRGERLRSQDLARALEPYAA